MGTNFTAVDSVLNTEMEQYPLDRSGIDFECNDDINSYPRSQMVLAQFAREENCLHDIASVGCVTDEELTANEPFVFMARAHLNPDTRTHPHEDYVMPYTVLHFKTP